MCAEQLEVSFRRRNSLRWGECSENWAIFIRNMIENKMYSVKLVKLNKCVTRSMQLDNLGA
jgi:hypothetical protein